MERYEDQYEREARIMGIAKEILCLLEKQMVSYRDCLQILRLVRSGLKDAKLVIDPGVLDTGEAYVCSFLPPD